MPYAELETTGKRIIVETRYVEKDRMKEVPGATWSSKLERWTLPTSWAGCIVLRGVFGEELRVGPWLSDWSRNEYEKRVWPASLWRTQLDAPGDARLFPFQRAGVEFLATAHRGVIIDEMGLGKTRQAIKAIQRLYELGYDPFPVLAVVPNSTKIGWKREAALVWNGLQVQVVKGSATARRKQLESPAHVYVINWEGVRTHSRLSPYGSIALRRCKECGGEDQRVTPQRCEVHLRELNYLSFNTVIADECHRMKDPSAKQTRAVWAATGDATFRFGLTGTPIADAPDDLWSILHWLDPNEWPSRVKYVNRWCLTTFNSFGAPTVIGLRPDTRDEFYRIVDSRMRRMTKQVVLPFLPPVVRERRDVEMQPKQEKAYLQMRDKMLAELDDEPKQVVATSPLTRITRLLQFSSSYATIEERWSERLKRNEEVVRLTEPSNKIDAFLADIDDFGSDSVVVFAISRQLIELLSRRLDRAKVAHGLVTGAQSEDERQRHIDDFQAGRTRFILCTIQAGGVGLTLTKGRIAVFLQRSWSMVDNTQAEARVHRIGSEQHDSIVIVDYVTAGTVEDAQIDAVYNKHERLEEITRDRELLRAMLLSEEGSIEEAVA